MTDKPYSVGENATGADGPAGSVASFKATEDSAHGAGNMQALDSRGVAKGTFENIPAPTAKEVGWAKFLCWEGGTEFDAFFTAASAQVGQVILSLPHSLSQTGMVAGIVMELLFASLAMWTVYLMTLLYLDHKNRKIKLGDWYDKEGKDRKIATQYHEVMGGFSYKWLGRFSRLVIIIALGGDALAQIIASSSNFHTFIPSVNKRDWGLVWGGVCMLMAFIPSFRNFRIFSFLALVATSFTAWFMLSQGIKNGLKAEAWTNEDPGSVYNFFAGASNIIFTFGGHGMLMEVMDAMYRPYNFHKTFFCSYSYVFTLVIPNTIFVYWGFPTEARLYGNCFAYFDKSLARDVAIVLMVVHQVVAYGLFIFPLYYMWEKALRMHNAPMWKRVIVRMPVGALIWFIAVAFPFFGVINDILGAFTVTFETFIIPCLVFNIHFGYKRLSTTNQSETPKQLTPFLMKLGGYHTIFWLNWVIIFFTAVFGLGMGGYASIKAFVDSISTFGVFAKCYNC